jgi:hypothetical protein
MVARAATAANGGNNYIRTSFRRRVFVSCDHCRPRKSKLLTGATFVQ